MSWWDGKAEEARANALANSLTGVIDKLIAENRELVQQIVELKREGFHPAPPPDPLQPVGEPVSDAIEQAIRERVPPGSALERQVREFARRQLAAQADEQSVVRAIMAGGDIDDDVEDYE